MSKYILTIITPNFNDSHYLVKRLEILLPTLPQNVQYLICDDGSTDDSVAKISNLIADYPNVQLVENPCNKGAVPTINRLFELAEGTFIYPSSANDIILDSLLSESNLQLLQTSTSGIIVFDPGFTSDKHSKTYIDLLIPGCPNPIHVQGEETVKLFRNTRFWIPSHSAFFRRELIYRNGKLDLDLRHFCDWYLNHTMVFETKLTYIPKQPIAFLCHHDDAYSQTASSEEQQELIFEMISRTFQLPRTQKSKIIRSGVFSCFGHLLFPKVLKHPKYWRFTAYMAIRRHYFHKKNTTFCKMS